MADKTTAQIEQDRLNKFVNKKPGATSPTQQPKYGGAQQQQPAPNSPPAKVWKYQQKQPQQTGAPGLTGPVMDLSTRVNYLNSLLDQGAINEEEYQKRAEVLENIGKMVAAVHQGNIRELEDIIQNNRNIDLNQIQEGGSTILHIAVESLLRGKGSHEILEILCKYGCAPDPVSGGFTPLLSLCQYAQSAKDLKESLNVLIRYGANVKVPVRASEKGNTNQTRFCLDFALTSFAPPDVIQLLCENGADPNTLTEGDVPVINWCCINAKNDEARILLNHGANPNSRVPGVGANCLASAINDNNVDLVKILLANGADKRAPVIPSAGKEDSLTLAKVLKLSEMERILQ